MTDQTAHTPGELHVHSAVKAHDFPIVHIETPDGQHHAMFDGVVCTDRQSVEQGNANAAYLRLCWNAHDDLLAACIKAERELNHTVNVMGRAGGLYEEALIELRAAIAKAQKAESLTNPKNNP